MSRVGRKVIPIPKDVKVQIEKSSLQVQGPKGKLTTPVPPGISFKLEDGELTASRLNDERQQRAFHGLARALANNAIRGVT
jgi:large subunit ribosomal protein L6